MTATPTRVVLSDTAVLVDFLKVDRLDMSDGRRSLLATL